MQNAKLTRQKNMKTMSIKVAYLEEFGSNVPRYLKYKRYWAPASEVFKWTMYIERIHNLYSMAFLCILRPCQKWGDDANRPVIISTIHHVEAAV